MEGSTTLSDIIQKSFGSNCLTHSMVSIRKLNPVMLLGHDCRIWLESPDSNQIGQKLRDV